MTRRRRHVDRAGMPDYMLDNRSTVAGGRFGALSALFDAVAERHLDAIGVGAGWRCWEVGAGGSGVPHLLTRRVWPTGRVLATDIEIGWLDEPHPGVEVRRHDVAADEPPAGGFDLVHARLVLLHIPERDEALRRMVSALRLGRSRVC